MKNFNVVPSTTESVEDGKEKLKEKIREILNFPIYRTVEKPNIEIDTRKFFDTNPSEEEIKRFFEQNYYLEKGDKHSLAQLCLLIIGEQQAYDGDFIFEDYVAVREFVNLVESLGILVHVQNSIELLLGRIGAHIFFARSQEDLKKMKSLILDEITDYDAYHKEYGRLMGFPETAIKAFVGESERFSSPEDSLINKDKFPQDTNLPNTYGHFVYSKDHADEEHAYFIERNRKLKEYASELFE
ncbi:MAG: hypothetical protein WCW47_03690 [Candidatus Paceibacterota bacterium]